MRFSCLFLIFFILLAKVSATDEPKLSYIMVLGIAQDGGYPHLGCQKICCTSAWRNKNLQKNITSLALVDPIQKKWWLFEATPDIKEQLQAFNRRTKSKYPYLPEGTEKVPLKNRR